MFTSQSACLDLFSDQAWCIKFSLRVLKIKQIVSHLFKTNKNKTADIACQIALAKGDFSES